MPRPHPATASGRQTVSFVGPADMKQPACDAPGGRAHLGGRGSSHELRQHPPLRQHTPNGSKETSRSASAMCRRRPMCRPSPQPRQVSSAGDGALCGGRRGDSLLGCRGMHPSQQVWHSPPHVTWSGWKEQNLGCQACQDCCKAPADSAAVCPGVATEPTLLHLTNNCALQASLLL